ncbi:MAG: carbohydrate ABC transporter permease [Firmicutes bacterium]|nr:carbohydrate ABC transporter permease [Bacillota bacterium]
MNGSYVKHRNRLFSGKLIAHMALILLSALFLLPFVWTVSTSLKPDDQIFSYSPRLIPRPALWSNYPRAFRMVPLALYIKNTLYYGLLVGIGTLVSCPMVAYSLARLRWPGRDLLFSIMIATLMIPYQVRMVPLFLLFRSYGWIDSYKPLIVPTFFGNAFYIFLLRQFFMTIPQELSDAARIDGCSELGIYTRIILPLAKPAMATVGLFAFLDAWRAFMGPLIYLNTQRLYPISLGLQQFRSEHSVEWSLLMAASTVVTVPIIVLFFFTQKTFIQGIALTGLKG